MKPMSARSLTASYVTALILIALLTVFSHYAMSGVLREQRGAASVINVSGRQRMLSQRIASLAAQYALGAPDARDDLLEAATRLETMHDKLLRGDEALQIQPADSPALKAIYFQGTHPLDAEVRSFVSRAREIAEFGADDPRLRQNLPSLFKAAKSRLLSDLDQVVSVHEVVSEAQIARLDRIQLISVAAILATLIVEALFIFRPMMLRIAEYTGQLLRFATIDQMTGALNRRSFHERGLMELARARRYRRTSSILMIDVDHFKDINDTYGHAAGDQVLGALGACLAECVRPSDLLGRLGGEEFGILLVETALANAVAMAERIRREVAALKVAVGAGEIAFTISLGVSELSPEGEDLGSAMDRADRSLYEAKRSGRNRVAVLPAVAPLEDRVTQPPGRQASRAL